MLANGWHNLIRRGGGIALLLAALALPAAGAPPRQAIKPVMPPELTRALEQVARSSALISGRRFAEVESTFAAAMPVLAKYEKDPANGAVARQALEFCMLNIGIAQIEQKKTEAAIASLKRFVERYPLSPKWAAAYILMGEAHALRGEWPRVQEIADGLLGSGEKLSYRERVYTHRLRSEACMKQKKWKEALPSAEYLYRNGPDWDTRTDAAVTLIICLARLDDLPRLHRFLPHVYETPARFDVGLNLVLVEEGDRRYGDRQFDKALMLYRLVFPKKVLIARLEERIADVKQNALRLEMSDVSEVAEAGAARRRQIQRLLPELEKGLEQIRKTEDYDQRLGLRMAGCYYELQRYLEALYVYRGVYEDGPRSPEGEQALYSCFTTAYAAHDTARSLREGYEYLRAYPKGTFWEALVLNLVQVHIQEQQHPPALALMQKAAELSPDFSARDQLLYLRGFCHFQNEEPAAALAAFAALAKDFPDGPYADAAAYWSGMCHLFLGQHAEARAIFEAFLKKYPDRVYAEDATYRLGMACYGMADAAAAAQVFEDFLNRFPQSPAKAEVLNMLGDIAAGRGDLDRALDLYRRAPEFAVNQVQANYAVFQAARTYELENRFEEIIRLFRDYVARYGEKGNFTEAAYWIGNACMKQGRQDEALSEFFDTIVRHGDLPRNYGVDMILRDLIAEKGSLIDPDKRRAFMDRLYTEIDKARAEQRYTLTLRLVTLFAETASQRDVQQRLSLSILRESNIPQAGPLTLSHLGRTAEQSGRPELAEKVYRYFLKHYRDSDLAIDALKGMARVHLQRRQFDQAVPLLEDIASRFAMLPDAAWAQLRLAEALRQQGKADEAIRIYGAILGVREWKGEAWAEALVGTGLAHREKGDVKQAFPFFQRVYVMYAGYPEWAATAYVRSAECLDQAGQAEQAVTTLQELLANERLANTAGAQEGRKLLIKLRGAR